MPASRRRFSQESRDELCREVILTSKPTKDVAVAYGVGPETLRNWLIKYRGANRGTEVELTLTERAQLKELQRENQDLRTEAAFLKKTKGGFKGTSLSPLASVSESSLAKASAGVFQPSIFRGRPLSSSATAVR